MSEPQFPHLYNGASDACSLSYSVLGRMTLQKQLAWHIVGAQVNPVQPSVETDNGRILVMSHSLPLVVSDGPGLPLIIVGT